MILAEDVMERDLAYLLARCGRNYSPSAAMMPYIRWMERCGWVRERWHSVLISYWYLTNAGRAELERITEEPWHLI